VSEDVEKPDASRGSASAGIIVSVIEGPLAVSVIIPAYNEARALPRLLTALISNGGRPGLEVIVVCNGCTDNSAAVARGFPGVRVLEIAEASKSAAFSAGDREAKHPIRAYVDADVVLGIADLNLLIAAVGEGVLAAAPSRRFNQDGMPRLVAWYYDVWERLPQVKSGLFGRGAVVISETARWRLVGLPRVMSDDLLMSEAFKAHERRVVEDAAVIIRPPRTLRDLVRRRIRVATGNAEMDGRSLREAESRTTPITLLTMMRHSPLLTGKVLIFLTVTGIARIGALRRIRAGDFKTWLRDDSSRHG
jgi:glycosyltransferase involved in cell wall biosynthesis